MSDPPDPRDPRAPHAPHAPHEQRGPLDAPEPLRRPLPHSTPLERVRAWVDWVGPVRLLSTAAVVLAVLAGAYWLVRPPAATTESTLPFARSASAPTTVTVATDDHASGAPIPDAPPATTGEVVVHVAGAVAANGVYRLPSGSRVIDAVQSAGGLSADAQPDAVNLAALLTDGARVYVPRVGETVPPFVAVAEPVPTTPQGPVNLNTATAGDLDSLPGIGPATAAAIVAYRDQQGPFASVDDLADVRGIGPAKVEALRGLVTT